MVTILRLLLVQWAPIIPKWILKTVPRASTFFFTVGYLIGKGYVNMADIDSLIKLVVAEAQKLL